jgi:hypothetical protein
MPEDRSEDCCQAIAHLRPGEILAAAEMVPDLVGLSLRQWPSSGRPRAETHALADPRPGSRPTFAMRPFLGRLSAFFFNI